MSSSWRIKHVGARHDAGRGAAGPHGALPAEPRRARPTQRGGRQHTSERKEADERGYRNAELIRPGTTADHPYARLAANSAGPKSIGTGPRIETRGKEVWKSR